ncbi:hypothetical protein [Odoribacter laneus]|uniref:hypothetical protein n=1 Tax=Odoribacter laneus TaxID=626933 RepID=UPI0018972E4C|nr:hypothetical protein [Odoribacter laneus]
MKKIIALVWVLALLVSCGTARKVQKTQQEVRIDSTATTKETNVKTDKFVDTTRTQHGKVTITEIEFYPPTPGIAVDTTGAADSSKPERASKPLPGNPANVNLQDVGNIKGAVKSIKQTVIESDVEEKGENKESSESKETESAANVGRNETNVQQSQEPTPAPYRWRYIFYISLIAVAILLYLKRTPIINWIKKILAGIRKIL